MVVGIAVTTMTVGVGEGTAVTVGITGVAAVAVVIPAAVTVGAVSVASCPSSVVRVCVGAIFTVAAPLHATRSTTKQPQSTRRSTNAARIPTLDMPMPRWVRCSDLSAPNRSMGSVH